MMDAGALDARIRFHHRLAVMSDLPTLRGLMEMAIRELVGAFLDPAGVEASFEIMGVDTQLIEDGTYFAVARWMLRASIGPNPIDHLRRVDPVLVRVAPTFDLLVAESLLRMGAGHP